MEALHNQFRIPLAERMRPRTIDEIVGQKHVVSKGKIIHRMIESKSPFSLLLYGGPGCGKTTIARIVASSLNLEAFFLSAVESGVADVRKAIEKGRQNAMYGLSTLLFIDEIHRFNKAQQDAVLGAVESGDVILLGATTENPSFSVIPPLLSRTRLVRLNALTDDDLDELFARVFSKDDLFKTYTVTPKARESIIAMAHGDARRMLNIIETTAQLAEGREINEAAIEGARRDLAGYYDKSGDRHYDAISAFIKSMRGSDPDAAVIYLAHMIERGEDPLFIARRMVIFASEDVGNASPQALTIAVSALSAVQNIGMPEARIILAQAAIFLACSPKSNAAYLAIGEALALVTQKVPEIPFVLTNAPTQLMRDEGRAKGYQYPHDFEGHFVRTDYFPSNYEEVSLYRPTQSGSEKQISERLAALWPQRAEKSPR